MRAAIAAGRAVMLLAIVRHLPIWQVRAAIAAECAAMLPAIISHLPYLAGTCGYCAGCAAMLLAFFRQSPDIFGRCVLLSQPGVRCCCLPSSVTFQIWQVHAAIAALRAVMLLPLSVSHLTYLAGTCGYCSRLRSDAACHRPSVA